MESRRDMGGAKLRMSNSSEMDLETKREIFYTPPRDAVLVHSYNESVMYRQPDQISASLQSVFVDVCVY
jgi:hypothetical protein